MKKQLLGLAVASTCLMGVSFAQELTGVLKKINDTGTISVGHRESSIPFSYYDNNQNVIGYSHDISMKIVENIEKKLGRKLNVKLSPITSQNRIPLVNNGTIDIECGSTTHNTSRAQEAGFSNTMFIINIKLVADKNAGIKDFSDLKDKVVITTAGTTSERVLNEMNQKNNMNMKVQSLKDHGDAFMMLAGGRGAAFVMDDSLLYGERAKSRDPQKWVVTGTSQGKEAYACMFKKDDAGIKEIADVTIAEMSKSGELEALYNKWFTQPIPPRGVNLEFPVSEEMIELFKAPNDKAFQ